MVTLTGADAVTSNMTKIDTRHYSYSYLAGSGNGAVNVSFTGKDLASSNQLSYDPISGASFVLDNAKTVATVNLDNPAFTYDGTAKAATATTTPAGLAVTFTYNGSATAPSAAGSYAVTATVNDANYQGSATGTLVINKATPTVTWNNPAGVVSDTPLGAAQLNATASVPGSFAYTPAAGQTLEPGSRTLAVLFTPNDASNYTTASATVSLTVLPLGNMSGGSEVTLADALLALQSAVGLHIPTPQELSRGDVAPLIGGKPAPDGKIDIADAVVLLRKVVKLVNW